MISIFLTVSSPDPIRKPFQHFSFCSHTSSYNRRLAVHQLNLSSYRLWHFREEHAPARLFLMFSISCHIWIRPQARLTYFHLPLTFIPLTHGHFSYKSHHHFLVPSITKMYCSHPINELTTPTLLSINWPEVLPVNHHLFFLPILLTSQAAHIFPAQSLHQSLSTPSFTIHPRALLTYAWPIFKVRSISKSLISFYAPIFLHLIMWLSSPVLSKRWFIFSSDTAYTTRPSDSSRKLIALEPWWVGCFEKQSMRNYICSLYLTVSTFPLRNYFQKSVTGYL